MHPPSTTGSRQEDAAIFNIYKEEQFPSVSAKFRLLSPQEVRQGEAGWGRGTAGGVPWSCTYAC